MSPPTRGTPAPVPLSYTAQYQGLRALSGLLCALPEAAARSLGAGLGRFVHGALRLRRVVAEENLRAAFPALPEADRGRILREMYAHFGRGLATFARFPVMTRADLDRQVTLEGEPRLREALKAGRGAVLLSAHLGDWEMMAATLAARGYPMTLLVGPQRNKRVQEMFRKYRGRHGVQVIVRGSDLRQVFRALEAGRVVATVGDQDAGPRGYFVDFLGRPASTALGPYRMARRANAPLVIGYSLRLGGKYVAFGEPPLFPDPGVDPDVEARAWSRHYHALLERVITEHPEQWFWVHRRWRSRPPDTRRPDPGRETDDPASAVPPAAPGPRPPATLPR